MSWGKLLPKGDKWPNKVMHIFQRAMGHAFSLKHRGYLLKNLTFFLTTTLHRYKSQHTQTFASQFSQDPVIKKNQDV